MLHRSEERLGFHHLVTMYGQLQVMLRHCQPDTPQRTILRFASIELISPVGHLLTIDSSPTTVIGRHPQSNMRSPTASTRAFGVWCPHCYSQPFQQSTTRRCIVPAYRRVARHYGTPRLNNGPNTSPLSFFPSSFTSVSSGGTRLLF
jgi:hypothetical protein